MSEQGALDVEAIVSVQPTGKQTELRLWLRMLSCTNLVSAEIRRRLRREFGVTLPRFDLLAQLQREPEGLRLGQLSQRMMVTNGNLTGLIDRLVEEGLVTRKQDVADRRAATVRLTKAGARAFARMAAAHEAWLTQLLSSVDRSTLSSLTLELEQVKASAKRAIEAAALGVSQHEAS